MFVTLPSIRFPLPVQALPPLPESTVEPMPPGDDPRLANAIISMSPRSWYKYSVLQNSDSYPNEFFSWESSDVHMGDVVVPSLALPEKYPESKEEDHATGWMMVCFTCPFAGDRGEADRNRTTGYPFCDERMLSREPLVSWSTLEEPDLEVPISNATDEESIMACTVELNLRVSMTTEDPSAPLEVLSSQFFIANRTLRGPESEYPERRYRYNETFPKGVQDNQVQLPDDSIKEHEPFFVPTPTTTYWWEATSTSTTTYWWEATSTSGYGYSDATRGRSSDEDEDLRSKTGVMIGTIVPFLILTALIACFCRWKRDQKRSKEVSAPVPRNFDPAADARRQAALSERRYSARRDFITAEVAAARNLSGRTEYPSRQREPNETVIPIQDEPEELPPAYHKVVTNQERMEIEQRMHAEGTTPQGWPPSYRDARNAGSTSLSRPVPAASTPEQDRALYPALPSSPPRW